MSQIHDSFGPYLYVVGEEDYPFTEEDIELGERQITENPRSAIGMKFNYISSKWFRAFLHQQEFRGYIDFASGVPLPPNYPLHVQVAPAKVLYNDHDPKVVAESRRRYGHAPNIQFVESPLENIDYVLSIAEGFFGSDRRLGVFLQAVVYFVQDEPLAYAAQRLYNWLAPGSLLVVTGFPPFFGPAQEALLKRYRDERGIEVKPRTVEELLQFFPNWRLILNRQIEDLAQEVQPDIKIRPDLVGTIGYGLILERP